MTESMFSQQREIIIRTLQQIAKAIDQIKEWCSEVPDREFFTSSKGYEKLASCSMLLQALCEGYKKIDNKTNGELLKLRPEIPWKQVKGMRDYIAHGYFEIDADTVWEVIQNDLDPLKEATLFFLDYLEK